MHNELSLPQFAQLKHLEEQPNNHSQGIKRVFIKSSDTSSALTQFAFGAMKKGEESGFHKHDSMDEYFYFIRGNGSFWLGSQCLEITSEYFIRVPAGTLHNLMNKEEISLEFVYFGIAM